MKKNRGVFLICLILLITFYLFLIIAQTQNTTITGSTITGEATSTNVAVIISVLGTPSIAIIKPENGTYITNLNIQLNYTQTGADMVWYNIDAGSNMTLTGNTTFNTTSGPHILYIYANNSNGETSDNVTFTVDSSKFKVHYNECNGANKGGSTNFNSSSYEDLQNLSEVILENTYYGKIKFNEPINVTADSNFSDKEVNLDAYINISSNRIEINSTALPNFNKSAALWLYNLTFSNPRILRNGSVCPDTICTEQDYSGGTLIFNVTEFTVYSSEETPAETVTSPSRGGGGRTITSFSISPEDIKVKLKQGETELRGITITNNGNKKLSISIENPKLEDFLKISEKSFDLNPKESKSIVLDIFAREETAPDLYIGKLIVRGGGIEKEILVVIEVESEKALLDVSSKIPDKYKYILPGEEVLAETSLYNLAGTKKIDVFVEYIIFNDNGKEILNQHETITVETSASFSRSFIIPEDAELGRYFLYVKTTYKGLVASASSEFNVGSAPLKTSNIILFVSGGVLIILLIIIFLKIKKIKKHIKIKHKRKEF